MDERDLFLSALEIDNPAERMLHLESLCAENIELMQRVEALLASHENHDDFLRTPAVAQLTGAMQRDPSGSVPPQETSVEDTDSAAVPPTFAKQQHSVDQLGFDLLLNYMQPATRSDSLGRLHHYELLEVVGRGAFGFVFKAFDEKLQRVVAIKVMALEVALTSPARKRFLREAQASAAIRHENAVAVHSVDESPIPFLVMEFIAGQTLQQHLDQNGPIDLSDVLRLGIQIAQGLAAAHSQQLIHRDVKPGNILLEGGVGGRVKITDFGLARTVDDASLSQSGVVGGTPLYMAPEQALGHTLDQRTDLFSLGSVLYQMLSGRPPFRAPSTLAVMKRVAEDTPRDLSEIVPEVPAWMRSIIGRLHEKNPDDRFATAAEVVELLQSCLTQMQQGREPVALQANPAPSFFGNALLPLGAARISPRLRYLSVALLLLLGLAAAGATVGGPLLESTITWFLGAQPIVERVKEPDNPTADLASLAPPAKIISPLATDLLHRFTSADYQWSEPVNLGPAINTQFQDTHPTLSADGLCMIYLSNGRPGLGLYEATRDDVNEPFDVVKKIARHPGGMRMIVLGPGLSADGLTLVGCSRDDNNGFDFRIAYRAARDQPWGPTASLGPSINSDARFDLFARLSPSERTLVISTGRPEHKVGGYELWMTQRASNSDPWEAVTHLGIPINSPQNESSPQLLDDGKTILFTRGDRVPGRRRLLLELQLAVFNEHGRYDVFPIPSPVEHSFWLLADGETLIFSAERDGGLGDLDLWQTRRVLKTNTGPNDASVATNSAAKKLTGASGDDAPQLGSEPQLQSDEGLGQVESLTLRDDEK